MTQGLACGNNERAFSTSIIGQQLVINCKQMILHCNILAHSLPIVEILKNESVACVIKAGGSLDNIVIYSEQLESIHKMQCSQVSSYKENLYRFL